MKSIQNELVLIKDKKDLMAYIYEYRKKHDYYLLSLKACVFQNPNKNKKIFPDYSESNERG